MIPTLAPTLPRWRSSKKKLGEGGGKVGTTTGGKKQKPRENQDSDAAAFQFSTVQSHSLCSKIFLGDNVVVDNGKCANTCVAFAHYACMDENGRGKGAVNKV